MFMIKSRIDPIPKFDLVIQTVDNKEIIILEISRGLETPYYYVSEGTRTAYHGELILLMTAAFHDTNLKIIRLLN